MKQLIKIIVSLDTECDKGPNWNIRKPLSFTNITQGVPNRLQPLFESFGVKPTYLLSPEVIMDDECVQLFNSLGKKVELGTHLHAEFIDPEADVNTDNTRAFQSDYSPEIERLKLSNLTNLFKNKFTYSPRSFRAGRYGISQHSLKFLEELGYLVDSSIAPFTWWWRRRGEGVNFLGAPLVPYHPSKNDFRKAGNMKIIEAPISLINPFWQCLPSMLLRRINPINRYQTIFLNTFFKEDLKPIWLRPTYSTPDAMMKVTQEIANKNTPSILCMMFHCNEATAAMSPYNKTRMEVIAFLKRLENYFINLHHYYDVEFIGLSEVKEF